MHLFSKTLLGLGLAAGICTTALAQPPVPDPTHVPFVLPENIKWSGTPDSPQQQATLFGDPSKPGIYGVLIKWNPGHFSQPHIHSTDRFAYVISGTWWVSSDAVFDENKMYPMVAGTFVENVANTVHYDGAKAGGPPAIFEMVGMGPMVTTQVDANGKPKP